MLYSEEFLRAARDRLTPGGVFAQWFHLYETDEETVKIVLRTYKKVFGDMAIWFTRSADILLLGFKGPSPALDLDALRARFESADYRAGFQRAEVGSFLQLLAHEIVPLGAVSATEMAGPVHTLRHPILSDSAARAFFTGNVAPLPPMVSRAADQEGEKHSLLGRELAGREASEDVLEELTRHVCAMSRPSECAALVAYWTASHPDSPRLARTRRELRTTDTSGTHEVELAEPIVENMVRLYRGQPLTDPESPAPLRNAIYTSNFFAGYYDHTFPFDRAALQRAWTLCSVNMQTAVACAKTMREAERQLGPIYPASLHD
jgi:hypothetical protein